MRWPTISKVERSSDERRKAPPHGRQGLQHLPRGCAGGRVAAFALRVGVRDARGGGAGRNAGDRVARAPCGRLPGQGASARDDLTERPLGDSSGALPSRRRHRRCAGAFHVFCSHGLGLAVAASCCIPLSSVAADEADAAVQLQQLKEQIAELRQGYELRLQALERRIAELQSARPSRRPPASGTRRRRSSTARAAGARAGRRGCRPRPWRPHPRAGRHRRSIRRSR